MSGPAASGQPIAVAIDQRATVTNLGSTTGGAPTANSAQSPTGTTTGSAGAPVGDSAGATAKGLSAQNNIQNTALVDVAIGGSNHAPITVAVKTISTIVNNAIAVVETAVGGGDGAATADSSGLGARVTNRVNLDGAAIVDIPGDNHSPITIVLHIAADLWNTGRALLGLDGGAGGPGSVTASGLEVDNILKLLGRASVHIGGSNYAPIDIQIILENIIRNDGIAAGRTAAAAGSGAAAAALAAANGVSSGPASCLSLLSVAGVVNDQNARVSMPVDNLRRQVLAGNGNVVDVQGHGTARCSTGDVVSSGAGASSGQVTIGESNTTLAIVSTQIADASAITEKKPSTETPGGSSGTGTGTTAGSGGTHTAQVVVAVTRTPVKKAAAKKKTTRSGGVVEEDIYEWVVVWEPLYVIYPSRNATEQRVVATLIEEPETETTTSMAGAYTRPETPPTPTTAVVNGLDLLSQIQVALLGVLGFLLLALLKRRMRALDVRRVALRRTQFEVLEGRTEAAAE